MSVPVLHPNDRAMSGAVNRKHELIAARAVPLCIDRLGGLHQLPPLRELLRRQRGSACGTE